MPPRRIKRLIDTVNGVPDQVVRGMVVERNPRLAGLLGVGLVAVPRGFASVLEKLDFTRVAKLPPDDVLLYRAPVPRARLVHRAVVAADEETSFARTVDPQRDLLNTAVLETTQQPPALAEPPAGATESVAVAVDLPERVEIAATLAAPGVLVLTDTWYPGWSATVDGAPAPILRADYGFRAVALPAGEHRVVFRYAPDSLRLGLALSAVAALVLLALLVPRRAAVGQPA